MDQIGQLLLSTTIKQVVVANVVGIPLAYYLTQKYLQKFSEHISLTWWHYTYSGNRVGYDHAGYHSKRVV